MLGQKNILREVITTCALVTPLALVVNYWADLPDVVPIHFGIRGQPDNWGSKWWILLLPTVSLVIWAILVTVRRFPHRFNYPFEITPLNRKRQEMLALNLVDWLRLEIAVLFALATWLQVSVAVGRSGGLGIWFLPGTLAILVITIGMYFRAAGRKTVKDRL